MPSFHIKKLTMIAMLSAASVAGRIALMNVPQVKPVLALTIIAGHWLGAGSGFLVGAVSMLVSNMVLGQGIWTIWQMLAAGAVGAIFGMIKTPMNRWILAIYGGLAVFAIYGGIMNLSSLYMFNPHPSLKFIVAYCVSGLPFDVSHGVATSVFLIVFYDAASKIKELHS